MTTYQESIEMLGFEWEQEENFPIDDLDELKKELKFLSCRRKQC